MALKAGPAPAMDRPPLYVPATRYEETEGGNHPALLPEVCSYLNAAPFKYPCRNKLASIQWSCGACRSIFPASLNGSNGAVEVL